MEPTGVDGGFRFILTRVPILSVGAGSFYTRDTQDWGLRAASMLGPVSWVTRKRISCFKIFVATPMGSCRYT